MSPGLETKNPIMVFFFVVVSALSPALEPFVVVIVAAASEAFSVMVILIVLSFCVICVGIFCNEGVSVVGREKLSSVERNDGERQQVMKDHRQGRISCRMNPESIVTRANIEDYNI